MEPATVPEEFRPLLHPKLLEDASTCQVVWARVKGYPFWPAQVLNEAAAAKKLGKVAHRKLQDVPVMFFGTLEIAWIGSQDIVAFRDGVAAGYLSKGKHKNFVKACTQVHEFLVVDKKRKAPQYWWCRAPDNGNGSADEEDVAAAVIKPGKAGAATPQAKSSKAAAAAAAAASGGRGGNKAGAAAGARGGSGGARSSSSSDEDDDDDGADGVEGSSRPGSGSTSSAEGDDERHHGEAGSDDSDDSSGGEGHESETRSGRAARRRARAGHAAPAPRKPPRKLRPSKARAAAANGNGEAGGRGNKASRGALQQGAAGSGAALAGKASTSNNSTRSDLPAGAQAMGAVVPEPGGAARAGGAVATAGGLVPAASAKLSLTSGSAGGVAAAAAGCATSTQPSASTSGRRGGDASGAAGTLPCATVVADSPDAATAALPPKKKLRGNSGAAAPAPSLGVAPSGGKAVVAPADSVTPAVPPQASSAGVDPASGYDIEILKLPAEIRRLAGIKIAKKPSMAPGAALPGTPPADVGGSGSARAGGASSVKGEPALTDDDALPPELVGMSVSRRETRFGGSGSAGKSGAAQGTTKSTAAAAPTAAAPAASVKAGSSEAVAGSAKPPSPTASAARRVAAGLRPAGPGAAPGGSSTVTPPASESDRERARRAERESQLQRKRERERERRQALREQKAAAAAAAGGSDADTDGEDGGGRPTPTLGVHPGEADVKAEDLLTGAAADKQRQGEGDGDAGGAGGGSAMMHPVTADDLDVDGTQPAAPGRPPRPGSNGGVGGRGALGSIRLSAIGSGRGWRSRDRSGRGASARGGAATNGGASSDSAGAPPSAKPGTAVPVVSLGADGRRGGPAIPPVVTAGGAVVVATQPARRSRGGAAAAAAVTVARRGSDGAAGGTSSEATAGGSGDVDPPAAALATAQDQPLGLSEEDLQDAEAAEALQFMQSMSLPAVGPGRLDSGVVAAAAAGLATLGDSAAVSHLDAAAAGSMAGIPAPMLSQLEAALGLAASFLPSGADLLAGSASGSLPPQETQVYKPQRRQGPADCEGFQWPNLEPLLPAPGTDGAFYLPAEWLLARPPKYEPLKRSLWVSRQRPKRLHKQEANVCACTLPPLLANGEHSSPPCGPNCLNRLSYVSCDPKLCACGEACTNRPLHMQRCPRMEPYLTDTRGWGVRALQLIPGGSFIIEYVGEVIDDRELARRMELARVTAQHSYYIMELAPGLYVDARTKGNVSRLLNSSCQPNCETQKWHDAATGEPRIGIFAKRDIAPGEELTYDYFFEQYSRTGVFNSAFFKCTCGAPNCRGTMDNPALASRKNKDYGRRIEVHWDGDGMYYQGTVVEYSNHTKRHVILYDDGDIEKLNLEEVPYRWLTDGPAPGATLPIATNPVGRGWGVPSGDGGSVDEGELEEVAAGVLARRYSQDSGGVASHAPLKKRQRTLGGGGGSSSAAGGLPPLFQGHHHRHHHHYHHHHQNHREPAFFGGDMESLLQAVEVELGDREAAAQQSGAGMSDGAPPGAGVRSSGGGRSGRPPGTQPRRASAAASAVVSSAGWQQQAAAVSAAGLLAPPQQPVAPLPLFQPARSSAAVPVPVPVPVPATTAPAVRGHSMGQQPLTAVSGGGAAGGGGITARCSEPGPAGASMAAMRMVLIEELLGIRISTFDLPLFHPAPQPTAMAGHASGSGHLDLTPASSAGPASFGTRPSAAGNAGGGATGSPAGAVVGVAAGSAVGSGEPGPPVAPHLQRSPITTASPGAGPSSGGHGGGPRLSNPGAPPAVGQQAQPPVASPPSDAKAAAAAATKLSDTLALLVHSPLLADLPGLPFGGGGLCGLEALATAPAPNLFVKRNGTTPHLTAQPTAAAAPAAGGGGGAGLLLNGAARSEGVGSAAAALVPLPG